MDDIPEKSCCSCMCFSLSPERCRSPQQNMQETERLNVCVGVCVCERDRDGVKVSAKSHSPNLIMCNLLLCHKNMKIDKNGFLPFIPDCDELFMCVWSVSGECGVPWRDEEGLLHTSMEYLYFTVFGFRMNEWIVSPEPQSLYLFLPQSLSSFNIFPSVFPQ